MGIQNKGKLEKTLLPHSLRFKSARPPLTPPGEQNPYTYSSPIGNGASDLMTPYYGFYSHHYGPVYQLLTPVSGYGGYPGTIDPRGFNAPVQNYTHGAMADDFSHPTKARLIGKNGLLLGQTGGHLPFNTVPKFVSNSLLGGGMMPAAANGMLGGGMMGGTMGARTMGGMMGAGMMGGMLGGMMPGAAGPMLPVPGLASNSGGMRPVFGLPEGTIPVVHPNGVSSSSVLMPSSPAASGVSMNAAPALQAYAATMGMAPGMNPFQPPGGSGMQSPSGLPMRSPYNPTYSMGMMQHRALTLNGAANGFITPGFFHPMSDHYPTPDMDRYSSVITHPVLPPDYGHGSGSGSGK